MYHILFKNYVFLRSINDYFANIFLKLKTIFFKQEV